jgi:hypothetical protein
LKTEVLVLYSTIDPACGQTDEKATKLPTVFPEAVRITITPLFATNSLIAFSSVDKLMVIELFEEDGFEGCGLLGVAISSLLHAAARQAMQERDKNSVLFMFVDVVKLTECKIN